MKHPIKILLISLALLFAPLTAHSAKKPKTKYGYVTPSDAKASAIADATRSGKLMMRVTLMGAVSQGIHYFPEDSDLLAALMYVGGYTEEADLDDIAIRRKGQKELIYVDLEALVEDGDPIPKLKDGDIVTVDWNWKKDLELYYTVTSFVTSITAFTLALVAVSR